MPLNNTRSDPETNLHVLHTKHAAVNNSIINAHANWAYLRTSFDQAVEQAEATGIDRTNEFENWEKAQLVNI